MSWIRAFLQLQNRLPNLSLLLGQSQQRRPRRGRCWRRKRKIGTLEPRPPAEAPPRATCSSWPTAPPGSSFVGEFFNQQGNIFYLFERCGTSRRTVSFEQGAPALRARPWSTPAMLKQLFLCDLYILEHFIIPGARDHLTPRFVFRPGLQPAPAGTRLHALVKKVFEVSLQEPPAVDLSTWLAAACRRKGTWPSRPSASGNWSSSSHWPRTPVSTWRHPAGARPPAVLASRMVAFADRVRDLEEVGGQGTGPAEGGRRCCG